MSKRIKQVVRLLVPAGQAKPAPPVGPALGQAGLNIMSFCKDFNAQSAAFVPGIKLRVVLTAYTDKSFTYKLQMPPASHFLLAAAGVPDGAPQGGPAATPVGSVTLKHLYEIAKVKSADDPEVPLESWCKQLLGTAKAMGITVTPS